MKAEYEVLVEEATEKIKEAIKVSIGNSEDMRVKVKRYFNLSYEMAMKIDLDQDVFELEQERNKLRNEIFGWCGL